MDDRYEIRDAQFFAGELADEGLVDGQRVGAIGGSYGGGLSLQLATLKDRVMMPDGSLVPWTSPVDGISDADRRRDPEHPMERPGVLAHARTARKLDYVADASYSGRPGIEKQSFQSGLYLSGQLAGQLLRTGSSIRALHRLPVRPHRVEEPDRSGRALRRRPA